ncbi:MAG: glycosyltransferase family 2 protein [Acidobacteriota bacterium]|nr:MAG: glycosyltransferase family 2 protein [Acidobacteriota bacterium]
MPRPFLSACVIARDEQERIGRCLASMHGLADETLVVDTGSSDRTAELARAAGARVVEFAWCDDFAAARNAAIEAARGSWILMVDADEVLDGSPRRELEQKLRSARVLAFSVEIFSPRGGGRTEIAHVTRLFRNEPGLRYRGRVYEQMLDAVCDQLGVSSWTPPRCGLRLLHEGYLPHVQARRAKAERNRRLLRAEIRERPQDPGTRFLLARELTPRAGGDVLDMPSAREALELLQPAVERLLAGPPRGITDPAVSLAVRLAVATGALSVAEQWSAQLRQLIGPTARGHYAEGELTWLRAVRGEADPFAAAACFAECATAPDPCEAIPTDQAMRGAWASLRASVCRSLLAPPEAALAGLVAETAPASSLGANGGSHIETLLVAAWGAARGGDVEGAIARLGELVRRDKDEPRAWWALSAAFALAGGRARAESALETALRAAPGWRPAESSTASGAASAAGAHAPAGLLAAWGLLGSPDGAQK